MNISESLPRVHQIYCYRYRADAPGSHRITGEKTQYVYRILYLASGRVEVRMGQAAELLTAGDALYLVPGEVYSLWPCGEDFALYALSFDFSTLSTASPLPSACVFLPDFDVRMLPPPIAFEDAPCLDRSGVFRHLSCERRLEEVISLDRTKPSYAFLCRTALCEVLAAILTSDSTRAGAGEEIVSYVRAHPTADLSGEALSSIFSYHKNHINKLVRGVTGMNLGALVRSVRIHEAKVQLSEGIHTPTELALALGYYDYSHFYKAFLAEVGMTPTEYAKMGKRV